MKKYVLFLFTAWLVPWALAAQTTVASGTCGADGDNLSWALSSDGTLTINGSGAMADYEGYGSPWYDYAFSYVSDKEIIKKIVVHEGVTSIGNYAFENCWNAESISLPGSVERTSENFSPDVPIAARRTGCSSTMPSVTAKSYIFPLTDAELPESFTA